MVAGTSPMADPDTEVASRETAVEMEVVGMRRVTAELRGLVVRVVHAFGRCASRRP